MKPDRRTVRRAVTAMAAALLAPQTTHPARATAATWLTPADGTWTDASRWSTSPYYPNNNTPAGATYDTTIAAPGPAYLKELLTPVPEPSSLALLPLLPPAAARRRRRPHPSSAPA